MKECTRCHGIKPVSDFYVRRASKDGLQPICKKCDSASRNERYFSNHEEEKSARRQYQKTDRGKLAHAAAIKSWRARSPERTRAHRKVRYAIMSGRISPLPCFVCGEKAEAHHPDYAAPLDVVWLCVDHHKEAHLLATKPADAGFLRSNQMQTFNRHAHGAAWRAI